MTGNLGTRFPQNLHTQPKYFTGVPLFDKIYKDMTNIFLLGSSPLGIAMVLY